MTDESNQDQQSKVTVYRTSTCPFCVAAERLLKTHGVEFEEVLLDDHPDRRGFTETIKPGHRSVPLVVIDDTPLGGLDDLETWIEAGGVATLRSGA